MSKENQKKNTFSFDIPEDFVEKHDEIELYKSIRDNKKIYALTTFARAVPYYKDGLIEAYRRALFDMISKKIRSTSKTVKSALIVGDIIGRFHPHGDQSAYQSIVTLSQPWTNNYPLVYGLGNWGNVLGNSAAHYRYTECRPSEFFDDVCEDIKEEYVDFIPNFDNSCKEVAYIPFKIPIILVNGSYGIADSYMTSMLPHNLNDVVNICEKYIKNKQIRNEVLVDGFFPDFPNYGIILNKNEIEMAYKFNTPANVKMKATMEVDRINNTILIKDLPYNMTGADVKNTIKAYCDKQHAILSKILNIIDIKTKRDNEVHIDFEVLFDKSANILEIARDLEKLVLSKTIPISQIMYNNEYVNKVSIKDIIAYWYDTLYTTKLRKISYHQSVYTNEIHILEGKYKIYDYIDPIVEYAKKSESEADFINYLTTKYELTSIQAKAIINMRIQQLNKTSKEEILKNIEDDRRKIDELDEKSKHIDDEIISDLEKIKAKYGRPRRTVILEDHEVNVTVTSIPMSNGAILWSRNQYAIFDINNLINGKSLMNGVKSVKVDGKNVKEIVGCHNIKNDIIGILIFMKDGTAKRINVSDIVGINNWISISDEPVIDAVIPIYNDTDKFIAISDTNKIKISSVESFGKQSISTGNVKIVQSLDNSKDSCLITTESGKYHLIKISDIPELGRNAAGVILNVPDNEKLSMIQIERFTDDTGICTIVDNDGYSYIMKTEQDLLEDTNRANKAKSLFELDSNYKLMNINPVNTKDKDHKCILIGKNSISQISMQNIRSSDITKVPKKVPVSTLGIVTFKL